MSGRPPTNGPDDKRVTVSFSAPDRWGFDPRAVRMQRSGKLVLEREPGARWRFVGADVIDGGDEFSIEERKDDRIRIHNRCRPPRRDYVYRVTVELDGQTYTSPGQPSAASSEQSPIEGLPPMFADPPVVQNDPT